MNTERIALTFGDAGENHIGNQMLGKKQEVGSGFTTKDLMILSEYFVTNGFESEYIDLTQDLVEATKEGKVGEVDDWGMSAGVLIIRRFVKQEDRIKLYGELKDLSWDRKYYDTRRKKVLNKNARANLVFVDDYEQEPVYEEGKGRVIDSIKLEKLSEIKTNLMNHIDKGLKDGGSETQSIKYICEGNRYYDLKKCGIGYHGDKERTRVICLSVGTNNYPMRWVWFYKSKPITKFKEVKLDSGDVYIMSEKAVGYDWSYRVIPTLRHAAGSYKYINLDKYENK